MSAEIEFENTYEDWMSLHFFQLDQLSSLKRNMFADHRSTLVIYVGLGAFITLVSGFDALLVYAIIAVFILIVLTRLQSRDFRRGYLFRRLRTTYEEISAKQKGNQIRWRITPTHLILDEMVKEIRIPWSSVERIVVCPRHVFVVFAGTEVAGLPRRTDQPQEFASFLSYMTDAYRSAAEQQQRTAEVDESDWQIDFAALHEKGSWGYTLRTVGLSLLYGAAFWVLGFAVMYLIYAGIFYLASWFGYYPEREGLLVRIISKAVYLIAALSGLLGLMMGLYGKLPGTRVRRG